MHGLGCLFGLLGYVPSTFVVLACSRKTGAFKGVEGRWLTNLQIIFFLAMLVALGLPAKDEKRQREE